MCNDNDDDEIPNDLWHSQCLDILNGTVFTFQCIAVLVLFYHNTENFMMAFLSLFKSFSYWSLPFFFYLFACFSLLDCSVLCRECMTVQWPICNIVFETLVTLTMGYAYAIRLYPIRIGHQQVLHPNCFFFGYPFTHFTN